MKKSLSLFLSLFSIVCLPVQALELRTNNEIKLSLQQSIDLAISNNLGLKVESYNPGISFLEIRIYDNGKASENTRLAYKEGTFLNNLKHIFSQYGINSIYKKSVFDYQSNRYMPDKVASNFDNMLGFVKMGFPVIIHVTPHLERGEGHYLLIYGYDDKNRNIYYIDPNPYGKNPSRSFVSYESLRNGKAWFRGNYFFTGRFLAVTR